MKPEFQSKLLGNFLLPHNDERFIHINMMKEENNKNAKYKTDTAETLE